MIGTDGIRVRAARLNIVSCGTTGASRRYILRVVLWMSYLLATLQFLRSYFIINQPYLDAHRYESGTERLPYQSRMLLSVVMRYANNNYWMTRMAAHFGDPFRNPDVLALLLVDLAAFLLLGVVVSMFYRHLSQPHGARLSWLPFALVLWMASATYIVRFQEAIYFPYDLPAAFLFTLCVYLSYVRRYALLLPLFVLCCFNRETTIMVVPLVLINMWFPSQPPRKRWVEGAIAITMIVVWLCIRGYFLRKYAGNGSDMGLTVSYNLHFFASPQTWSQIASACGFLLPVPLLFWHLLPERRLRAYSLLIPTWLIIMFLVGLLPESRVFGELIGLVAVLCTLIFERAYGIRADLALSARTDGSC